MINDHVIDTCSTSATVPQCLPLMSPICLIRIPLAFKILHSENHHLRVDFVITGRVPIIFLLAFPCLAVGLHLKRRRVAWAPDAVVLEALAPLSRCQTRSTPPTSIPLLTAINTSLRDLFNHFPFQFQPSSARASGGLYSLFWEGIND